MLGRPCLRSFGICSPAMPMRPVRLRVQGGALSPKDLGQAHTAPALDHGLQGAWQSQTSLRLPRNRHACEPLHRFWAMIDTRLSRVRTCPIRPLANDAENALPAAPMQAPHRSRDLTSLPRRRTRAPEIQIQQNRTAPRRRPGPQSVKRKVAADGPRSRPSPGRRTAKPQTALASPHFVTLNSFQGPSHRTIGAHRQ